MTAINPIWLVDSCKLLVKTMSEINKNNIIFCSTNPLSCVNQNINTNPGYQYSLNLPLSCNFSFIPGDVILRFCPGRKPLLHGYCRFKSVAIFQYFSCHIAIFPSNPALFSIFVSKHHVHHALSTYCTYCTHVQQQHLGSDLV